MTPEELQAYLRDHPAPLVYGAFILAGSLISFFVLGNLLRRQRRLDTGKIGSWPIRPLDFGLFLVSLLLWFLLSGTFVSGLYQQFGDTSTPPGALTTVLGGFLLQGGMLYLFLRFRFHYRQPGEGPLSPQLFSFPAALFTGLACCLASLPVVYAVGALWNLLLEFLRSRGFPIELPMQEAVLLFQEASHPIVLVGLLILAVGVAPVVEELVFRAGIYRFLKGRSSRPFALLISGALFGVIHGNLQSLPGLVAVGVCLGLAYEISGNLRVPIFFHAFFNLNSILWIQLLPEALP